MNAIVEKRLQAIYEKDGEIFTQPSLTIPDDSMSITDILINFTRGTMPPISKVAQYGTDEDNQAFLDTDHPLDGQVNDLTGREIAKDYYDTLLDDTIRTHGAPFEASETPKSGTTSVEPPEPSSDDE